MENRPLKELYEKDFYLWVQENLKLLKNREYDLVDWENLLEELEGMGRIWKGSTGGRTSENIQIGSNLLQR
jgi:hypothetical protein